MLNATMQKRTYMAIAGLAASCMIMGGSATALAAGAIPVSQNRATSGPRPVAQSPRAVPVSQKKAVQPASTPTAAQPKPVAAGNVKGKVKAIDKPPQINEPGSAPVIYWEETINDPRPVHMHFLRVDMASPDIEVVSAVGADPDGDGPATSTLRNPIELATENKLFAALNANAFWHLLDATEEEQKKGWYANKHVRLFGLVVDNSRLVNPHDSRRAPIWFDANGKINIYNAPATNDAPRYAVADWEGPLLKDGKTVFEKQSPPYPRALGGVDASGRFLLLAFIEGRMKGYSEGLTLEECAAVMRDRGCNSAINFDGGGSAVLLIDEGNGLAAVGSPKKRWLRPVPVMIGIRAK